MPEKVSLRVLYLTIVAAVVGSFVGGYAVASLAPGTQGPTLGQGSEVNSIQPVEGLTWVSTSLIQEASIANTANCDSAPGCNVSSSSAMWCGNPCGSSEDFFEVVVFDVALGSSAILCGTATTVLTLTLSYTSNGIVSAQTPGYFYDTSTASGTTNITLFIDVTAAGLPEPVSQVTTIASCA
jgi:hypothetical protein